jgi:hypothetical protein
MCIVGCAPKEALYDYKNNPELNKELFHIEEISLSSLNLKEISKEELQNFVKESLKKINFYMNDYLYQGCIIQGIGTSKNAEYWANILSDINRTIYMGREDIKVGNFPAALRPTEYNHIVNGSKESVQISIRFIFSHNKSIKSYLFSRTDWIHVICPKLSLKYLKQNKDLKHEDCREGVNILYLAHKEDIDESFRRRLTDLEKKDKHLCILCNNDEVFERILYLLERIETKREWAIQDSWI